MNKQAALNLARELTYKLVENQQLTLPQYSKEGGQRVANAVIGFHEALVTYFEAIPE